ncbi:MAG: ATP-binding protein [Deltaproteobacteria bacterium]|nr:ATP-binding protein [Deltaproteobacteria bacterium]
MIQRALTGKIRRWLTQFPAVGLLGPRQCGKSTLAKQLLAEIPQAVYLDLERPADLNRLRDPEAFFAAHANELVCLDEIQRQPELFPFLRSILDERGRNGHLLVLGSASPQMLKQSSETLAGRIGYLELTPFLLTEITEDQPNTQVLQELRVMRRHWLRGGFPRSYLASSEKTSHEWREAFIRTFLEQDVRQLGVSIPQGTLRRFWQMCAHSHGQLWNASKLAQSLGVSQPTVQSYLGILQGAFMIRVLPSFAANLQKRLVKAPKVYVRDPGILHALLRLEDEDDLLGHPTYGSSWEGYVVEQVLGYVGAEWEASFYRTSAGAECDLILQKGRRLLAIECKVSTAPEPTRGFWNALEDLTPEQAWVVAPVEAAYPIQHNVTVTPLFALLQTLSDRQ